MNQYEYDDKCYCYTIRDEAFRDYCACVVSFIRTVYFCLGQSCTCPDNSDACPNDSTTCTDNVANTCTCGPCPGVPTIVCSSLAPAPAYMPTTAAAPIGPAYVPTPVAPGLAPLSVPTIAAAPIGPAYAPIAPGSGCTNPACEQDIASSTSQGGGNGIGCVSVYTNVDSATCPSSYAYDPSTNTAIDFQETGFTCQDACKNRVLNDPNMQGGNAFNQVQNADSQCGPANCPQNIQKNIVRFSSFYPDLAHLTNIAPAPSPSDQASTASAPIASAPSFANPVVERTTLVCLIVALSSTIIIL